MPLIEAAAAARSCSSPAIARWRRARRCCARAAPSRRFRLLVQGEAPRERLLEDFRADGNAVLLGTASFWEGVDVKGEALRLVVIEKLPFASPGRSAGARAHRALPRPAATRFATTSCREAVLALKQGVGRLIRSEDDTVWS